MSKRRYMIWNRKDYRAVEGKWVTRVIPTRVEVMAIAGNYAMVRVSRCAPFVAHTKQLMEDV